MVTFSAEAGYLPENKLYRVRHSSSVSGLGDIVIANPGYRPAVLNGAAYLVRDNATYEAITVSGAHVLRAFDFPPLDDGDLLLYEPNSRKCLVLYSSRSEHNALFVTARCNCRCQMCPQPPAADETDHVELANEIIRLADSPPAYITVTGGEPTLTGSRLVELVSNISQNWPTTTPTLLTNARLLSNHRYASQLVQASERRIRFGVPLYGDSATLHDSIVGVPGAFSETVGGLLNLAANKSFIELRVVVQKRNIARLGKIVSFVGRNLPFVSRIALMAMEPQGWARTAWGDLWPDPVDYHVELIDAAETAERMAIPLLLFNYQLCVLPSSLRPLARCSISDWKNVFIRECGSCSARAHCAGFFQSQNNPEHISRGVTPLLITDGESRNAISKRSALGGVSI